VSRSDTGPGLAATVSVLLRKELLLEWRTRARVNALVFFALSTLLLFSFAMGADNALLRKNAGGYLWLALLFSSVLALSESFRVERENGALDGLRASGAGARAIFLAKALANTLMLVFLALVVLPVLLALYGVEVPLGVPALATVVVLGCLAISAPGTLYAAVASHARARDVLLPLLLFPLLIPALVAAAKGTSLVFAGDPMQQLASWLGFLVGFNLVYWGLGVALFPWVIED
jgi:heme exporter protein B